MKTFNLSDEDAEYIRFILEGLISDTALRIETQIEFIRSAHRQYTLGDEAKNVDRAYLEAKRDGLVFLVGIRERFVPVPTPVEN